MRHRNSDTEKAMALFESHLREQNLKITAPRKTVLEVFLGIEDHVSAETLFHAVRDRDPSIGQATVFRTIKLLEEAGLARAACRDEGPRLFEHAFRRGHHDHLVCTDCGSMIEFREDAIERSQAAVYRKYGFEVGGHSLTLYGLCPSCAKKSR